MSAGNLTIVIWLLLNVLFVGARVRVAYAVGVEAAGKIAGGERSKRSQRLPVVSNQTSIQTSQTNSTSNSPIQSGQVGQ